MKSLSFLRQAAMAFDSPTYEAILEKYSERVAVGDLGGRVMWEILEKATKDNGLVTAFAVVGLVVFVSAAASYPRHYQCTVLRVVVRGDDRAVRMLRFSDDFPARASGRLLDLHGGAHDLCEAHSGARGYLRSRRESLD